MLLHKAYLRNKRKGFSLLELLLVMGIIAALIIAAFVVYPKIQAAQRANVEISNISIIESGIKSLYSSSADYTGVSTTTLLNAKIFPDNMVKSGAVYNVFKGRVTVEYSNYSDGSYQIFYYNVPDVECSKITAGVFNKFGQIQINGTVIKSKSQDITVDIAKITSYCNNDNNNRLIFNSY